MKRDFSSEQFNLLQICLYHLLPGLALTLGAYFLANPQGAFALPLTLALLISATVIMVPGLWIIMLLYAKKHNKKIKEILGLQEKISGKQLILWVIPCLLFALGVFILFAPIERNLWTIFEWFPSWFRIDRFDPATADKSLLLLTNILNIVIQAIIGPLTEELYFRGFLLPRMKSLGKLAPFFNILLFSLYHLFTPWENITRILALLPYVYASWQKDDIRIGIWTHCLLNLLSAVAMLFG